MSRVSLSISKFFVVEATQHCRCCGHLILALNVGQLRVAINSSRPLLGDAEVYL